MVYNRAMKIPITQSKAWQILQQDLNEKSFLQTGEGYQYLAILKSTPVGNYLYLPYGPVFASKKAFSKAIESLKSLAKKERAIFIRIEPQDPESTEFLPKNAKKVKNLSPQETWCLDLTGNEDELKAKLPSRLLRYYKNAAKNHLEIETTKDPDSIHHLLKLQRQLASKKGINTFSETYLKTELTQPFATLYLVKYQNPDTNQTEVVAAGLVFDDEDTRYNLQGAQSETGKKLHATGILTIQLILDAKAKGQKIFDFWGIASEGSSSSHPWYGFTSFKKTFAGYEVKYAGTFDIILNPFKYQLYQFLRKINSFIHKH